MHLDDARIDGLEVDHAGIAAEVGAQPVAAVALDLRATVGQHGPVVEHAFADRPAGDVAPPPGLAFDHGDVGADVLALEQRHPHVPGLLVQLIVARRAEDPAARAHAAHVVDRLGEHRERGRRHAVQTAVQALRFGDQELVVDPAILRKHHVGVAVFGRDEHLVRTGRRARNTACARGRARRSAWFFVLGQGARRPLYGETNRAKGSRPCGAAGAVGWHRGAGNPSPKRPNHCTPRNLGARSTG